ncbi:serine/threonine-protein kinase [Streptomyces sp. NBC_01264]|uniref:serine/threonine-protein kinase n=1 Tax=Streptomyces sp. NBC_01264 TaxID=2903804 RepID=UPI0022532242|nr:serine/threonine-protein kinase [Streptomyces sp. NBC_01264]MCX4782267.1 protein kinase [Streptomyces sp. NBC_01264]
MSEQHSGALPTRTALSADDPQAIGGYRLRARLGSGGMGVVYLAHTPGGRPIALKAVRRELASDPEFRRRFAQEVASARRIHGLFTAQVIDSGVEDPTPWLATAYVSGPSLHEVVRRHGPLPTRTVLLLLAGIAEALQAIHGAGVVHRDLKPANVLLAEDGPRVIDFGIARAADAAALTGTGLRIGTAAFMAPEQALGHPATPATDVFALGTLAAYVACGIAPFGNGPESSALYRVVHEHPDLTRVPHELYGLVSWCLAKQPGDRPQPAEVIASVRAHPLVCGHPEFTDGWLPRPVREELGGGGGGAAGGTGGGDTAWPAAPAPFQATRTATAYPGPAGAAPYSPGTGFPGPRTDSGARPDGQPPAPASVPVRTPAPSPVHSPAPSPVPAPASAPAPGPAHSRTARGRRLPLPATLLVACTLLATAGAVYYLDDPAGEARGPATGPTASASATPPPGSAPPDPAAAYLPGYTKTRLTAPDSGYEFDLKAGKVVPAETAAWYLARDGQALVPSEDSDSFVSDSGELTVAACLQGIATRPAADLPLAALAQARPFCVRSPDRGELAIVRLVEAPADDSVTILVDQYRRT